MFPLRDHNHSHRFPLITVLLIIANVLVFLYQLSLPNVETFVFEYGLVPAHVNLLNLATLAPFITSMFLHGGWLHIISNMWFLWIFGDNIEATLGHVKYILFYVISGLAAALLQYLITPGSEIPMVGASGAIAGVLGGYLVLFPAAKIETLIAGFGFFTRVNVPASFMLFYWFATQLFSGAGSVVTGMHTQGGVAFFAHIGGFAAGWLIMNAVKSTLTWRRIE